MSDDTTTWLKKNPAVNPLRKSLKTSLRFHVPSSDLNNSIMSNPDKVKDQGLFIPRMLQRSNMQMRKSRASEFKIPEMMTKPVTKPNSKPLPKKGSSGSGVKQRKIPTPNRARKSLLPVSKAKGQKSEKNSVKSILPRASFFPNGSLRRTTAKRELIKKAVELSELKRREEEAESQMKAGIAEENSILRSILKKRTSLRRTSQISAKKPKAKKVLFDRFEGSDGEKENENDPNLSPNVTDEFHGALDEPTVFLDFHRGGAGAGDPPDALESSVDAVLKLWQTYQDNLSRMQTERSSLEDSFESLLQHSLSVQQEYRTYRESAEKMYEKLSQLGREIEEGLKRAMEGRREEDKREGRERKEGHIGLSEKSKAIKRNSGRKSAPVLKKEWLRDMEDSFSIICRNNL